MKKNTKNKMGNKIIFGILIFIVLAFISLVFVEAQGLPGRASSSFFGTSSSASFISRQSYQPSFQTYYTSSDIDTYWPILRDSDQCEGRQDLSLQVAPGGCQPQVVRSDLLAEQNVPVFCQIDGLELNPFSDVKNIRNIRFRGEYPKEVSAVGFHPAKAALRTRDQLLGSPLINNIGYVVVVLKKQQNESALPDFVNLTLTGQIEYDTTNTPGVGRTEFLLKEVSDDDWEKEKNKQSFWQGRYFVRLEAADENKAFIAIYQDDRKITTTQVELGKTSKEIYLPGGYCKAGVQVAYDGFEAAQDSAVIEFGDSASFDSLILFKGSRFLNDKCSVRDIKINPDGETGSVDVRCGSERLLLEMKQFVSEIFIDDQGKQVLPVLDSNGNPSVDLGKKGKYGLGPNDNIYLFGTQQSIIEKSAIVNSVSRVDVNVQFLVNLENALKEFKYKRVKAGDKPKEIKDKELDDKAAEDVFKEAIEAYEEVANDYPNERKNPGEPPGVENYIVGEKALQNAIDLAGFAGKNSEKARLINKFIDIYPNSALIPEYKSQLDRLYSVDSSLSADVVYLDNRYRSIRLVRLIKPEKKANATFIFGSDRFSLGKGEKYNIDRDKHINLTDLRIDSATISTNCDYKIEPDQQEKKGGGSFILRLDRRDRRFGEQYGANSAIVCGKTLVFEQADLEEVARVRLLPKVKNTRGDINMSVRVGIEKRLIQLSPEKTRERINNLNKSIEQFEKISKNLASVVKTLKTACFATGAVLTVKNFLTGFSGEALARQRAMQGPHGWNSKCAKLVSSGTYTSLNECFVKESDNIDREVKIYNDNIKNVNSKIREFEDKYKTQTGILGGKGTDVSKASSDYAKFIADDANFGNQEIVDENGKNPRKVKDLLKEGGYGNGTYTYDQLRDLHLNLLLRNQISGLDKEVGIKNANADLFRISEQINRNIAVQNQIEEAKKLESKGLPQAIIDRAGGGANIIAQVSSKDPANIEHFSKFSTEVTQIALFDTSRTLGGKDNYPTFATGAYILGLKKIDAGNYRVVEIKRVDGRPVISEDKDSTIVKDLKVGQFNELYSIGSITPTVQVSYFNRYLNPEVKYYENEPYKGMPALVPFNTQEGWYAATKQTLPVFGGQGAFEASGRVSSFWLCNVGRNGIAQLFEGIGDDICQQINLNTGQPYSVFPELGETKAKKLVNDGIQAITQAAEQYGTGRGAVSILGKPIQRGMPVANVPAVQCQNFMSPKECQVLFNVCDPVICPASRCNFGGKYQVADVVQTGIIGSTLLCLPNIREGIYVPVCLTGIQAGVDSYVSILKSHRDCLQENLDSGKLVGICDQIYSIYACEFFWRQAGPLVNTLLPRLAESLFGGGARGGGEYLTVTSAFDNARKSVDYFTQVYAVNSLKAFRARNVEEVGTEFCKAWISIAGPTAFKSLIEPDSPPQFYAWFDSIPFTTATVPATSQYKVFYHIFAGKDAGVSYSVYLKSPPEAGYYATAPYVTVATGFITKGQSKSETKDFTSPVGYKELCVRINAEEKCGFRQVSTDFAINQIRDSYAKDQLTKKDVSSEKECISGSPGFGALANPNIQAGIEEAAIPEIYNRGIVRICSTQNPGTSTDPTRFVDVGFCDDQKIRCYLDKKSVDKSITDVNLGVRNATLSELEKINRENLEKQGIRFLDGEEASSTAFGDLEKEKENVKVGDKQAVRSKAAILVDKIDRELGRFGLNHYKARLLLLRAEVKEIVARAFLLGQKGQVNVEAAKNTLEEKKGGVSDDRQKLIDTIARDLFNSMNGPGTDEEKFYESFGKITFDIANDLDIYFDKFYGGNLETWIRGDFNQVEADRSVDILNKLKELGRKEREKSAFGGGTSAGGGASGPFGTKWNLNTARIEAASLSGSYLNNKKFIDELYQDGILSSEEYNEINGNGLLNLEENMDYLNKLLEQKNLAISQSAAVSLSEVYNPISLIPISILISGEDTNLLISGSRIYYGIVKSETEVGTFVIGKTTNEVRINLFLSERGKRISAEYYDLLNNKFSIDGVALH